MKNSHDDTSLALYQIHDRYLEAFDFLTSPESEDINIEVVNDTLEAIQGEFEDKSINIVKYTQNIESTIRAIKDAETAMGKRRNSLERRIKWLKDYLKLNMEDSEITKIECPYFAIGIAKNPPKLLINDEDIIPDIYKHTIQNTMIDKSEIKQALKNGETIPGVSLISGTRLTIK